MNCNKYCCKCIEINIQSVRFKFGRALISTDGFNNLLIVWPFYFFISERNSTTTSYLAIYSSSVRAYL